MAGKILQTDPPDPFMTQPLLTPDICVIGAGSGGLSVAAGAAAFGVPVVLVERGAMGGDCLNTGCVPSKAMLSVARSLRGRARMSEAFQQAADHVAATIAAIAPHDSVERFEGLGVTVLKGEGRFADPRTLVVGETQVRARRFVIATGSAPRIPPIPGLETVEVLTNETLFSPLIPREHLIIIGGGSIGVEMAQAHRRLGSKVTLLEGNRLLPRDDPQHVDLVRQALIREGVRVLEDVEIQRVMRQGGGVSLEFRKAGGDVSRVGGTDLLLATGRRPVFDALDLPAAGVETHARGIVVDGAMRTTNRRIHAIGDVTGGPGFTHAAGAQASLLLRNLLFRLPVRYAPEGLPWVTYSSPEIAHVGFSLEECRRRHGEAVRVLVARYEENDRALAEGADAGSVKLYAGRGGRLLGADLVGLQAGELAALLSLAWSSKMKMRDLVGFVAPYPTLSELVRRAALSYYADAPRKPLVRGLVRFLRRFG